VGRWRAAPEGLRLRADLALWLGVIAVAWTAAYWLEVSGAAHFLHHHTIYHSGQILAGGLALLGAWQVMTAAMMLPGTLPAVLRISGARAQIAFIATYAAAWTCFAVVAFVGDMGLHALVHGWSVAARYENLIPAAILGTAAAYQLSPWKAANLAACRLPHLWGSGSSPLVGRWRAAPEGPSGGLGDALKAGITYSRQCLVSGWALMLIMFSAGVADLVWMAALALVMLAEKTLPSGDGVRYAVAGALSLLAAWTLLGGRLL
jgi:predicted metal-binding membrane protein